MGLEENEYVQLIGHKPQYTGIIQTTGGVKNVAVSDPDSNHSCDYRASDGVLKNARP